MILLSCETKQIWRMPIKLKERISWLMGTIQQSLFPHLDECLPSQVKIKGGYDQEYQYQTGATTVSGLTIGKGEVIVGQIIIR
jgi:hypothetical protein